MISLKDKHKKGSASFYVVAFSTLILVVIAASFTAVVVSNMVRTGNDDLAQSAYDSALAGIEDAKLAYYNYQKCMESNSAECNTIREKMRNPDCNMVAEILGRANDGGGVRIEEVQSTLGGTSNNLEQAYTCVKINAMSNDYRSTLTETNPTRVVRVKFDRIKASAVNLVKVNWYKTSDHRSLSAAKYSFSNFEEGRVAFPAVRNSSSNIAVPPTISVSLIQTAESFSLYDFTRTATNQTNRGTVFLVPTNDQTWASGSNLDNYVGAYNGSENVVSADQVVKSNDRSVKNIPFATYCPDLSDANSEFACSAWINLPNPVDGERSDETFTFVVSTPYGMPNASFSLEFYCDENRECSPDNPGPIETPNGNRLLARLRDAQIEIDSTGRANNLYRRIMARVEAGDTYFSYPQYALELLGDDNEGEGGLISKPDSVLCEYQSWSGFGPTC